MSVPPNWETPFHSSKLRDIYFYKISRHLWLVGIFLDLKTFKRHFKYIFKNILFRLIRFANWLSLIISFYLTIQHLNNLLRLIQLTLISVASIAMFGAKIFSKKNLLRSMSGIFALLIVIAIRHCS